MQVSRGVKFFCIGQHFVPEIAATTEGFFHQLRLACCGVEQDFDDSVLGPFFMVHLAAHILPPRARLSGRTILGLFHTGNCTIKRFS